MKRINAFGAFAAVLLAASCTLSQTALPCVISPPRACIGAKENRFSAAGIEFDFTNTSEKTACRVEISCYLYPAENTPEFAKGSNHVTATIDCLIPPGMTETLDVSLDTAIASVPTQTFLIDFFTVTEMGFTDGSSLEDRSSKYFTRNY
jgi:hypothetical protein